VVTKLLGVQIAHGLSSESRVFASLLAERDDRFESLVLIHREEPGNDDVDRFAELSHSDVSPVDTGWRPNLLGHRISPGRARVAVQYLSRIDNSVSIATQYGPHVVYSSQQHYDCRTATRVATTLSVPQIIHLHYIIGPWLRRFVVSRLRSTDHVVAVSDFIREQAIGLGVPAERVTTVRNTMRPFPPAAESKIAELRASVGVPRDALVYGMISRLDPSKGHADAITAFGRVAATSPHVWLLIAGSGRIEHRLKNRAAMLKAADRVVFLGQRSDVPDLLAGMDVFVHPATADPCPLSVLEAMASRLPVVGYDDGGVPELVEDGVTGLLAPHRDVDGLADRMRSLRDDVAMRDRLGAAAEKRLCELFRPSDAGEQFADVVTAVVGRAQ